jgi:hypothetical protein
MRWPRRTARLPEEARERLRLTPGERLLAVATPTEGSHLVATDRGLVGDGWRLDWSSVTHAQWYDEERALAVTWLDESGETRQRRVRLEEPGMLPETVHERVTASIVLTRRVRLPAGAVRVVARRQAGSDQLAWQVVPEPGVDLTPADARQLDAVLRRLGRELGQDPEIPGSGRLA